MKWQPRKGVEYRDEMAWLPTHLFSLPSLIVGEQRQKMASQEGSQCHKENDHHMDQGDDIEGSKKQWDSRYNVFVDLAGFADRMNLDVKETEGLTMAAESWVWGIERRTGLLLNRLFSEDCRKDWQGLDWDGAGEELLERFILDLWNGLHFRIKMKVLRVWSFTKGPGWRYVFVSHQCVGEF